MLSFRRRSLSSVLLWVGGGEEDGMATRRLRCNGASYRQHKDASSKVVPKKKKTENTNFASLGLVSLLLHRPVCLPCSGV